MIKSYLNRIYSDALSHNDRNVVEAIKRYGPFDTLLDVGCWDGEKTMQYASAAKAKKIFGIEPVQEPAEVAKKLGIAVSICPADGGVWPIKDGSIDCIVSNQVVEHLSNIDTFISQVSRVLKPGGILITSTNNLSSWHNIFALLMGWAPFDLTNSSVKALGIGNPFALHQGESSYKGPSWTHKTIYTSYWLHSWFKEYGFVNINTLGAGYYPLPSVFGSFLKRHCAFIVLVDRKS